MKEKFSRVVRSTLGFVVIGICIAGAFIVHVWVLFSNYNGIVQSFELLGYDQKPLSENRLFGWLFEAVLLGDATQCELYAGALVIIMAFSLVMVCHHISQLITLMRDRAIFLRSEDEDSARNIGLTIRYSILPWLVLWIFLALFTSLWDVELFTFRAFAGIFGIDDIESAVSMGNVAILVKEYGDRFSIGLTILSAWGYIAVVIATAFLLAFLLARWSDRWEILVNAFAGLFTWEPNPPQVTTRTHKDSTFEGIPVEQTHEETNQESGVPVPLGEVAGEDTATTQQTRFDMDEEVEIIGGNGKRIKRAQAIKDRNRFYVDNEGKVWDRRYYDSIYENPIEERKEAA